MPNVKLAGLARTSTWRRLAVAVWNPPRDPSIYGILDIDATALNARVQALRAEGLRVTITHIVAKALARAMGRHPDANVICRMGRIWRRQAVDIFVQVAIPAEDGAMGEADLSGVKIEDADKKSIGELAAELNARVKRVRAGDDPEINATKKRMVSTPRLIMRPLLRFLELLQYSLNLDLSWAGLPRDPFGSAMVTSVGMLGVDTAFAPLFPVGGPPIVLTVGAVKRRPVVNDDGALVARPVLRIGGAFDHRLLDGFHLATLANELRALLEHDVESL